MSKNNPTKANGRCYSPAEHAKALTIILREEFDVPFLFQDAKTGASIGQADPAQQELDVAEVAKLAASGHARVTRQEDGYHLAIPLYSSSKPILVGSAVLVALARSGIDVSKEQRRLEKWGQSVCERLRSSDYIVSNVREHREENGQTKTAWEAILTLDSLLGHLRVHKNTAANHKRILQAAFELLGAEALLLVPRDPDKPVLIQGEISMSPADCRQLASLLVRDPSLASSARMQCNDVASRSWAPRFPCINNLMAFHCKNDVGCIVALNKKTSQGQASAAQEYAPFRQSDVALLAPFASLLGLQSRTAERFANLKDLLVGLTRSLTASLDARDKYTCGHSERVGRIAVEIGRELGMSEDELNNVYLTGLLHDIGKIGIRDAVLWKTGPLTPEEREHMQQHVTIGYSILSDLHQLRDLLPGVLYHHEQYDGGGYPEHLAGEKIPLLARILAVADSFDAMSSSRPYRAGLPCQRIEQILAEGAGKQWDKRVIDAFSRCRAKIYAIRQRGVGKSLRDALEGAMTLDSSSSLHSLGAPVVVG